MSINKYEALKLDNQLCFPLYAASREVIKRYRPYLDALDLTYTQYITMMVMWEKRSIDARDLGKKLFLDSGTLTPVLISLEAKGLVRRYRSASDERVLTVEITEKGERLKESAVTVPEKVAGCVAITADEALSLHSILYKILKASEKE